MEPAYREKSTLRRALLPVLGGLAFFALLALATWGIAALLSRNTAQVSTRLAPTTFEVGNVEYLANLVAADGPFLFQGLGGGTAERSLVLDHTGSDPKRGWRARYAFPADRDDTCKVEQVKRTATYTDCEGRTLTVDDLAGANVKVYRQGNVLFIDLRGQ